MAVVVPASSASEMPSLGTGYEALGQLARIARESAVGRSLMLSWARRERLVLSAPVNLQQFAAWLSNYAPAGRAVSVSAVHRLERAISDYPPPWLQYAYVQSAILVVDGKHIDHNLWMAVLFGGRSLSVDPLYSQATEVGVMQGNPADLRSIIMAALSDALPRYGNDPLAALTEAGDDLWLGPDNQDVLLSAINGDISPYLITGDFCAAIAWTLRHLTGNPGYTQQWVMEQVAVLG